MAKARRTFTDDEKREIVEKVRGLVAEGKARGAASNEAGVSDSVFVRWDKAFSGPARKTLRKPAKRKKYKKPVRKDESGRAISRQQWNGIQSAKWNEKAEQYDQIAKENLYLRKRLGEMLIELELLNNT